MFFRSKRATTQHETFVISKELAEKVLTCFEQCKDPIELDYPLQPVFYEYALPKAIAQETCSSLFHQYSPERWEVFSLHALFQALKADRKTRDELNRLQKPEPFGVQYVLFNLPNSSQTSSQQLLDWLLKLWLPRLTLEQFGLAETYQAALYSFDNVLLNNIRVFVCDNHRAVYQSILLETEPTLAESKCKQLIEDMLNNKQFTGSIEICELLFCESVISINGFTDRHNKLKSEVIRFYAQYFVHQRYVLDTEIVVEPGPLQSHFYDRQLEQSTLYRRLEASLHLHGYLNANNEREQGPFLAPGLLRSFHYQHLAISVEHLQPAQDFFNILLAVLLLQTHIELPADIKEHVSRMSQNSEYFFDKDDLCRYMPPFPAELITTPKASSISASKLSYEQTLHQTLNRFLNGDEQLVLTSKQKSILSKLGIGIKFNAESVCELARTPSTVSMSSSHKPSHYTFNFFSCCSCFANVSQPLHPMPTYPLESSSEGFERGFK